ALEALQDQGLKAYLVSSVFASNLPLDEIPEPVAISAPSPSPGDSPSLKEIIEQKNQLEDEVRRYRTLIEKSGDMMYAIDHGGNIIFISNNVSGLLGYKSEELMGRNFLDLIPPDLHSATVERFSQQFVNTARGPVV